MPPDPPFQPSTLGRLDSWVEAHRTGARAYRSCVRIESLGVVRGWLVRVDLAGTALAGRPFPAVREVGARAAADFLNLYVVDGEFTGAAAPGRLEEVVAAFLDWAESAGDPAPRD